MEKLSPDLRFEIERNGARIGVEIVEQSAVILVRDASAERSQLTRDVAIGRLDLDHRSACVGK